MALSTITVSDSGNLEEHVHYHGKRKSCPHKSLTMKEAESNPGVIFRFPTYFAAAAEEMKHNSKFKILSYVHEKKQIQTMPTHLSDCSDHSERGMDMEDVSLTPRRARSAPSSPHLKVQKEKIKHRPRPTFDFPSYGLEPAVSIPFKLPKNSIYARNKNDPEKMCFSCGTNKTPYWRDGWDSVLLCNACGIRYAKYSLHCSYCRYIPRKDEAHFPNCRNCGKLYIR